MPVVFGEGAVAALWAVGLLALLSWMVCLGLRYGWMRTFGAVFYWLADVFPSFNHLGIHFAPGNYFARMSDYIANALEKAAKSSEATAARLFNAAAATQAWVAHEVAALAEDVYGWASWLQKVQLPRWLAPALAAVWPAALVRRLINTAVHAGIVGLVRRLVHDAVHVALAGVHKIAHAATGAVAIPGWVIHLPRRVGSLEKDRTKLWRAIRHPEWYLGAAAAAAVVSRALGLGAAKCVRSGNIGKAAKAFCGFDSSLVDGLLLDGLAIVGALSVVEFAEALVEVEHEALALMGGLVKEWPS